MITDDQMYVVIAAPAGYNDLPANIRHWPDVGPMLDRRPTLAQHRASASYLLDCLCGILVNHRVSNVLTILLSS